MAPQLPSVPRTKPRCPLWAAAAAAVLLCVAPAVSQVPEYEAKAEFLERFTRFIDWPAGSMSEDPQTPFVIGVLGRDPFGRYLDAVASSRRIKGKAIRVRRLESAEDATACHLLFVSGSESRELVRILARTEKRPILTVGDTPGYAAAGVLINLVTSEERITFEINEAAARKSGLAFSSKLLRIAKLVGEGH
jgi:hypothetical protein